MFKAVPPVSQKAPVEWPWLVENTMKWPFSNLFSFFSWGGGGDGGKGVWCFMYIKNEFNNVSSLLQAPSNYSQKIV